MSEREAAMRPRWAIALHGGAGAIDRNRDPARQEQERAALESALRVGQRMLEADASSMDAVEAVVCELEDCPLFNAGRGSVFTADRRHEMDAAVMDGRSLRAGAVAAVAHVRNPVRLARQVMQRTNHVLLMGAGAQAMAERWGVELADTAWFHVDRRLNQLERAIARGEVGRDHDRSLAGGNAGGAADRQPDTTPDEDDDDQKKHGTVGCVALDAAGDLAAATSTGGLTNKMPGRVGDTPIIGAGTYADNETCAVSCTGTGEQFIRHVAAYRVAALMEMKGLSLREAAEQVVHQRMTRGDGGLIAVSQEGLIAMPYSSTGMYRAAADASGHFEVRIWET